MEKFTPINEMFLVKYNENKIIKKRKILLPLIILLVGLAVIFAPLPEMISANLHWFIKPFIGFIIICIGFVKLLKAPKFQYTETQKPVKQKKLFYDVEDKEYLLECLLSDKINTGYNLKENSSTALSLIAYVESGKNFIAVQLQQFVPYEYQSITDTLFFHGERAQRLCKGLKL